MFDIYHHSLPNYPLKDVLFVKTIRVSLTNVIFVGILKNNILIFDLVIFLYINSFNILMFN
ncbi:hypothetical protein LX77_02562 [Gelidibacter algens]|uniref:Uncharacterized protein n=1 Tax=Gelidibacter algens TaxID=49280 RepID=A0A327S096_9FLAO|nr:hypothetical protein LX77_02562 [Gelidibacter algens]